MSKPQPKTLPFTNSFSGGNFSQIRGVTEHFFPAKYKDLECVVNKFAVDIKNIRHMEVMVRFTLNGSQETLKNLYTDENWKYMRTEYLLERPSNAHLEFKTPAPLFCLMLNRDLMIVDAKLRTKTGKKEVVYDADADILLLPPSFPPLTETEIPQDEHYVYYNKKSVVFYADIELGTEYEMVIKLEANAASFEFAPLFPFGEVRLTGIDTVCSGDYEISASGILVTPEIDKKFPDWFQYQLDKLASFDPMPPRFRPALPHRGNAPLFDLSPKVLEWKKMGLTNTEVLEKVDEMEIDLASPISLKNYETIRLAFPLIIPPDKHTDIIVRTINKPISSRIYEQIQKLPNLREVLVEYDIFNLTHKKLRLKVETEIIGVTERQTKTIFIHGLNNKNKQKARQILSQCPLLKNGVLESFSVGTKATMLCRVTDEDSKQVLFEETYHLDILANDEMIWEMEDLRSNQSYNLRDFICAWVTPTDKAGSMDKVRSEARAYHPDKILGHKTATIEDIRGHVKAIYEYLASQGISYLSQPFSSKTTLNSQRVVLPEKVLVNKAGNCIDLSVLFASILEGFGIYSHILVTPSHAFIGWGNKNDWKNMLFLETTLIGDKDFETALLVGRKEFEGNFLLDKHGSNPIFIPDIQRMSGNFMIDLQQTRYSGLITTRVV